MLSSLVCVGLLAASCAGAATNSTVSNTNVNTPAATMNSNTAPALNVNASTASGSTARTGSTFTAAEVAMHNTEKDCYAIVGNGVYDLTKWVGRHPGGPEAITGTCGKDISGMTHPGGTAMTEQIELVAEYKIGTLAQ